MSAHTYLIALGSNRCHARLGGPRAIVQAAFGALDQDGLALAAESPVIASRPLGPSRRTYANAAALVETPLAPPALLARLKGVERAFGRRNGGQRWAPRVLDLDIILWSGGIWASPGLGIPHSEFRARAFVLRPASRIAPGWRDPLTGRTLRQLAARLDRKRPLSMRRSGEAR